MSASPRLRAFGWSGISPEHDKVRTYNARSDCARERRWRRVRGCSVAIDITFDFRTDSAGKNRIPTLEPDVAARPPSVVEQATALRKALRTHPSERKPFALLHNSNLGILFDE